MESKAFKKELEKALRSLGRIMIRDRHPLRRDLKNLQRIKEPDEKAVRKLAALKGRLSASMDERRRRQQTPPALNYNQDLPVTARREEIVETIRKNQVVIISGETGSGKTTQIPKFCVEAGRGTGGLIAVTQPRRIAAVSVANRLAEEMGEEPGKSVGYKIRFHETGDKGGTIRLMTDGILLAEAQGDPFLSSYDTIIVDEAHERSLNIDFILGILRTLVKKRRDLKVIVTSATIDTEKFSKAFDGAPIIEVSGRTFPVETIHRPLDSKDDSYVDAAVQALDDLVALGPYGDILIFMPTEADIKEACDMIEGRRHKAMTVLPLYARLSAADQKRVFQSAYGRKVIVSTNVAETSITIPGIKYVIDTGIARIPRYSPRTRTTSLPVMEISRSSADQRKGRCGRVENGVCVRLFDEASFHSRPLFTLPEILRANLAEVILRMLSLRLGRVEKFPFVDPPSPQSIADGFQTLLELGAIHEVKGREGEVRHQLTETGRIMAAIPVDPKLARILIEASHNGCMEEVLVIISALTIRDPRERPEGKEAQADQKHAAFKDPLSDFITVLNIWRRFQEHMGGSRKSGPMKSFCKENYISFLRIREWLDIHGQLSRIAKEFALPQRCLPPGTQADKPNKKEAFGTEYTAIHKSILAGYLSSIATVKEKNLYNATKGREVMIFPGSGLFNKGGNWIVASEMVETSRLFARNVARIDSDWLEELGKDLIKRSHSNPRWEKKMGAVVADEQVTLFGLIVSANKKVLFGPIDPEEATRLFIRSALVEGDLEIPQGNRNFSFLAHNRALIDDVREVEDRIRRRDILISEEDLFAFYAEKVTNVWDIRTLTRRIKEEGGDAHLKMDPAAIARYTPETDELEAFPKGITVGGGTFSLSYAFEPGKEKDGVTLEVPAHSAQALSKEALDWVVPGLMAEKIEAMIKGLPKEHRKRLVPVSDTVAVISAEMEELKILKQGAFPTRPLITALGSFIAKRFGVRIPPNAWRGDAVSDHLKVRIAVTGAKGKELAASRDKSVLLTRTEEALPKDDVFQKLKRTWEKHGLTDWPMDEIPESVPAHGGLFAYPALTAAKDGVALTLHRHDREALRLHRKGVAALTAMRLAKEVKSLSKDLKLTGNAKKRAAYFNGDVAITEALAGKTTELLFPSDLRSRTAFEAHLQEASRKLYATGSSLLSAVETILDHYHDTSALIYTEELRRAKTPAGQLLTGMLRNELDLLVPKNFIALYEPGRLSQLERHIRAIALRAKRAFDAPEKDRAKAREVAPFVKALNSLVASLNPDSSEEKKEAIEALFWSIEEFKISVYAQEVGTREKVSAKRLNKQIREIEVMI
ncbi:ATP-dependent helicase [Desulfoluna limicola]|uniref:ATP-dependent helicase n=1 Tax=Desulfoluna limicola TaxID=2810562 RepID=A0ABM7PIY8_9BACT|nr:ATP-dependent RNA helicase HrpA [Desulfoluna limicola]BCS97538.1 ATP-dependent helicase [Desulfoluna limicola]